MLIQSAPKFLSGTKLPLYAVACNMRPCGQWGCIKGSLRNAEGENFPSKTSTFRLACIWRSTTLSHYPEFSGSMREGRKPFTSEDKRAAVELWKAKIPLKATVSENSCRLGREAFEGFYPLPKNIPRPPFQRKTQLLAGQQKSPLGPSGRSRGRSPPSPPSQQVSWRSPSPSLIKKL